jgi:hypothetical protein
MKNPPSDADRRDMAEAKEFASELSSELTRLMMQRLEQRYPAGATHVAMFAACQTLGMMSARSILALTGLPKSDIAKQILTGIGILMQERLEELIAELKSNRKGEWCDKCREWH